jgi:hypothetical protein
MEGASNPVSLSEIIVNAIDALSPEMPGLFGDQWPSVQYKVANMLQRALSQIQASRRDQQDEWLEADMELLYSLFDLFSTTPKASNRLTEVLESFIGPIPHLQSPEERKDRSSRRPAI